MLWEAPTGELLSSSQGHTDAVYSVAWSPDEKTLASGSRDHTVKLWETATGKQLASLEGHTDEVNSVASQLLIPRPEDREGEEVKRDFLL